MVEKALVKNPAVTIARMIKLKKTNPSAIVIPSEFIESLRFKDADKRWAVMILTCTTFLRIIPTKSPKVLKLKIEFYSSDDFLHEIGDVFWRNKIKTIYTTGICFSCEPPCRPYIGYIDSYNLPISEDQLKSELYAITNIYNIEITNVNYL